MNEYFIVCIYTFDMKYNLKKADPVSYIQICLYATTIITNSLTVYQFLWEIFKC